ncbi:MAG: glycosyltransferase [Rhodopila sp.]
MPTADAGSEASVVALARSAMAAGMAALAANDHDAALRWLDRAQRLVPSDPNAALSLASACLTRNPARSAALFAEVAAKYDVRQAWLGLAAARLRLTDRAAAADALARALSRHVLKDETASLARQITASGGSAGWCGLRSDGRLEAQVVNGDRVRASLDGKPLRGLRLPAGWQHGSRIDVQAGDRSLLGSPIRIDAIRRVSGCVEVFRGGLRGWAWHPGDPERPVVLTLSYRYGSLTQSIVANDETRPVPDTGPLAHARWFTLTRTELLDAPGPIHVRGSDGKDLLGSPLDPFAEQALHVAAALQLGQSYPAGPPRKRTLATDATSVLGATSTVLPADCPAAAGPLGADLRRRGTAVVIPVHNGETVVLDCLESVLASLPDDAQVLVVDDGSTDLGLVAVLDDLARRRRIRLLRHAAAQGFPASANAGIQAARGQDVVLLNSDTLVPPGWLQRLRDAAYAARDIGTVTPLSNDATILSYPNQAGGNPAPDQATTNRLDRLAERANGATLVDIPVGVGFCLFLRRDCLNAVGTFRADLFAQGYGEENDLCLRARMLGWRNVALTGLFVGHIGGSSFGSDAAHLRARNSRILERLHPGHQALINDFIACDPLAATRRRIDLARWREAGRGWQDAVILITHDHGGGVEARVRDAARTHAAAGRRPIVLRPARTAQNQAAVAVREGVADDFANLVFPMPQEQAALLRLLRATRPRMVEVHHVLQHPPAIYDIVSWLGLPYEVHVHDYAWFCPRVSLVGGHGRYCGEPELHDCEACIADHGHFLKEDIGVAALRRRSAAFLSGAARVVVPSADTGYRIRRHFPDLSPVVVPHQNDQDIAPPAQPRRNGKERPGGRPRVCIVGGIGVHKGYDIVLACARDAARRDLELEFVIVGHTIDDARMLATGRVFVTGRFAPDEAVDMIIAQQARLGFVASIWPETWCLSLGDIWRAGLPAAAFDIGAPAERLRKSGYGFLLPLGLSPGAINNALIAAIGTAGNG